MKILIASDIHGSLYALKQLLSALEKEKADRFILLGDFLYHGPRNPLPKEYNPAAVAELLNSLSTPPFCVRGNCDADVDQMLLKFPIMADYALLALPNGKMAFITHGHLFSLENPPSFKKGDVLIHGHTHVHVCAKEQDGLFYLNPGSVSLPKENQVPTYLIFDEGTFILKQLDNGQILKEFEYC